MQAGKLRSKIDLCRLIDVKDSAGGTKKEFRPYAYDVRCDDRVKSTNQKLASNVELQEEIHTIRIRYRNDILPKDMVRLRDGRLLTIEGYPMPEGDQKKRSLIITARYIGE
ncbi:phage head closure protein [Methylophaga sp.]|uniref:phage head closure protein n=1 Tax=Methylophaga sp. TaxID=2024840 RepID=UPI003A8E1907